MSNFTEDGSKNLFYLNDDGDVIINIDELVITKDDSIDLEKWNGIETIDFWEIVVGIVKNRERRKKESEEEVHDRRRSLQSALNNSQVYFEVSKDGTVWPSLHYPPEGFNCNIYHYQFDEFISLLNGFGYSYEKMMSQYHYKNGTPNKFYFYVKEKSELEIDEIPF